MSQKYIVDWIESIIDEKLPNEALEVSLKDGVILCKLMNKMVPGSCKPSLSKQPFFQMENINQFLISARKLGVPDSELFRSIDLFESKNVKQVEICICSVSRHVRSSKIFGGPFIGPKLANKQVYNFSTDQLNASSGTIPMQAGHYIDLGEYVQNLGVRRQITNSLAKEKENNK